MTPLLATDPSATRVPPRPPAAEPEARLALAPASPPAGETCSERIFLGRQREHALSIWAVFAALSVALHAALFAVTLPSMGLRPPDVVPTREVMFVRKYVPPPPRPSTPGSPLGGAVVPEPATRRIPVPDPTPMDPEPIIAARPEAPEVPLPLGDDVVVLLGDPEPPPARGGTGPLLPGVGGVTEPELLVRVEPEYPEVARRARLGGRVVMQAVIHKDGTVGDVRVLHAPPAHLGFEDEAVSAVRQWRYRPATQGGRPVDVYFTVVVNFSLQ